MRTSPRRSLLSVLAFTVLLGTSATLGTGRAAPPVAEAGQGDFSGLVDIGRGRRMYLECRGQGSPTVVLVSGYGNHGGVWSITSDEVPQPQVLPAVVASTRVCAYDRPGTVGFDLDDPTDRSRSDPVAQPTTAAAAVADLHALLHAAAVPGPYVLVGHSLGGLYTRLYAATYPEEVAGMVLVDAISEQFRAQLTPEEWAISLEVFQSPSLLPQLAAYRDYERIDFDAVFDEMLRATAARPLRPLPLVVLSAGVVPDTSELGLDLPLGFQESFTAAARANQAFQARLLPDARQLIIAGAGHYIQVEQPQVVIDAIQQVVTAVRDPASWSRAAAGGTFASLVDIGGGRRLYLECRGTGSPTVVLEAGYRSPATVWTDDLVQPEMPRTMVFDGVAAFTRVCLYERPGVTSVIDDAFIPSRSDPVPQPRSVEDVVADLHALLRAANVPGPYVLAAHSFGGLLARLYAATYPDEVVGLILVDAWNEALERFLTPAQWAALLRLNAQVPPELVGFADYETIDFAVGSAVMRRAAAAQPLRPLPLAVLARTQPLGIGDADPDIADAVFEASWRLAQEQLATRAPRARYFVAAESAHYIQLQQPALVTEAIRQVVAGVRDPDTWDDLVRCCQS